ncbi:MAG TPA: hypothetical protein VJR23_15830 [Candidatus Acidoferrales bacterium]|nr:hypothetical protein [Candidatus Acidoferrales bacterium]
MNWKGMMVVVLSALLYLPAASAASNPVAAQLTTSKGTAVINGVAAPGVTSVFAGDCIATAKQSLTSLTFPGGDAIVIPELSKAVLGVEDGHLFITLEEGSLSVLNKNSTPIEIRAAGARIEAANGKAALYEVTLHGNALLVVSRSGMAHVEAANRSGDVPTGMALKATFAPAQQPVQGVYKNGFTMTAVDWSILGIAAATGLGVGIYEATKGSSSSPS